MSIALVTTAGFGNGTLTGTIGDVVTRGYTIGAAIVLEGNKMYAQYESKNMTPESKDTTMMPEYIERDMTV